MLKQLTVLLFFSSFVFPQSSDSLLIQNNQSNFDTTFIGIADTLLTSDSTKIEQTTAQPDSLIPIQGEPLTDVSAVINKNTFLFENYRYTGDLLRSFNLNFIKDLGFVGYPNETFIYGVGNGGISYMLDGVLWNNRYTNSLDLNMVQSEDIDSIEIVPSPRGFLYGPYNNPVTVNFITKDFIVPVPYARIKYYQGPDAEAMIDGRFSALLAKRWNLSFEITNRSIDSTYTNTEFSFWNVNAKLKYYLSNAVNITGWYYFVSTKQGLNGGVNVDSIANIPSSYNIDMYSLEAPVVYPNQKLDVLQNNFGLRLLANTFNQSKLDLTFYYKYSLDALRNGLNTFNDNLETKTLGGALNYHYDEYKFLDFWLGANYDANKSIGSDENNFSSNSELNYDYFSVSGVLQGNLLGKLIQPSIYYKYNNIDWQSDELPENFNEGNSGFGLDINVNVDEKLSLYAGYSGVTQFGEEDATTFEVGGKLRYEGFFTNIKYFSRNYFITYNIFVPWWTSYEIGYAVQNAKGLGINLNYKYWVLLLETNFSYYFDINNSNPVDLPDIQLIAGLYVNGLFFNNNLDLKTGFVFYYTGEQTNNLFSSYVSPTNKLDFTLAGEIKKVAIFYFIWENLFYEQYYITPYYPMPDGNIRFGIAWELFN